MAATHRSLMAARMLAVAAVSATLPFAASATVPPKTPAAAVESVYTLPGATEREIKAPNGDIYRVMIFRPQQQPPEGGYPVLYVLDGDDNFPIAVATARRLIRAGARSGVEPGIIVAIDSGSLARRARDYTPKIDGEAVRQGQPGYGLPTGGADAFLDFIVQHVHPAIAADTPINSERIAITGHSFGGLLVLRALHTRPDFFSTYIAASPSLWLGGGQLLNKGALLPKGSAAKGQRVFINIGKQESDNATANATPSNSWTNAQTYRDALTAREATVTLRQLSGENHGSTMPTTITDAIKAAFTREPTP